jgi:hypothetical protein
MAQIFHRSFNVISKASIVGAGLLAATIGAGVYVWIRSSYVTFQGVTWTQPVPFSHQHHVNDLGIDCRYCHTSVEESHFAGIPPTKTCMNCHSQIWLGSSMLEPVRESYRNNTAIPWQRVHNLADFAYFNHSIHVAKGVGCATCHGRIDHMPLTYQENTLLMEWCLECHRNPENHVRPREQVFNMAWKPSDEKRGDWVKDTPADDKNKPMTQAELGRILVERYNIRTSGPQATIGDTAVGRPFNQLVSCGTCHH